MRTVVSRYPIEAVRKITSLLPLFVLSDAIDLMIYKPPRNDERRRRRVSEESAMTAPKATADIG